MKKILSLLLILLGISGLIANSHAPTAQAQGDGLALGKIIYLVDSGLTGEFGYPAGDLFSIAPGEAAPVQQTAWGYNYSPVLSTNGQYVAYLSVASFMVDLMNAGEYTAGTNGSDPANIWLWELATGEFTRIADQPATADEWTEGVFRSRPAWSPDGTQLAWVEFFLDGSSPSQLVVYDVPTGTLDTWATEISSGFQDVIFYVPDQLGWGNALAWTTITFGLGPDGSKGGWVVDLFDLNGFRRRDEIVYVDDATLSLASVQWVLHNGAWVVGLRFDGDLWQILDPVTGARQQLVNPPALEALSGNSIRLIPVGEQWSAEWTTGGTPFLSDPLEEYNIALSPDGLQVALATGPDLFLWEDGGMGSRLLTADNDIEAVVWGPMQWNTDGQATPGVLPPQLIITPSGG